MVFNEGKFLPLWLRQYGKVCGISNLYVLDHGSNDGSTANADQEGWNRIRLPRTEFDDIARLGLIQNLVNGLLEFFETVIFTDADEFLVPDPARYGGLKEYCEALETPCAHALGMDLVHVPSIEPALDPNRPVLSQRRFCRFAPIYCKPLIIKAPIQWGVGFHRSNRQPRLDPDLILFHLKRSDAETLLSRQAIVDDQVSWSARSIANKLGIHQRMGNKRHLNMFDQNDKQFRNQQIAGWGILAEIASALSEEYSELKPDKMYSAIKRDPVGKLIEIPARFRASL